VDSKLVPRCASCKTKDCAQEKDCFNAAAQHRALYENETIARLHKAASAIEARYYCREPRLREVILFAKELGCQKIGLAFCIGLSSEAEIIEEILSKHFEVVSVCCKACGIPKKTFDLERIRQEEENEVMCNPAGQAKLLNDAGTELNIICGLCVGHDAIFSMKSKAPVTTLIAKDRVLAHNPVGAIYSQYIRRKMLTDTN
jgi:uncharacterized metal-binding protein